MGILVFACTLGIVTALAFFCLGYVRLAGSNHEQRTAIEAAALSAAMDLTRIVIFTPEYGYVGLSDAAPSGSYTNAPGGDGYCMPVHGINTLLATARLNLMIASVVPNAQAQGNNNPATYHTSYPDPLLQALALKDLSNTYAVKAQLQSALNDAVLPSPTKGPYYDINGNQINVYSDALAAYQANPIRMTGASALVANSLKLTPGCLTTPIATNIVIPQGVPASLPQMLNSQQSNGCYNAYIDCPFTPPGGTATDFYFAGIGNSVKLVDKNTWVANLPNLPNTQPEAPLACVIKAEADQSFAGSSASFNGGVIHAMACASPANVVDPKPAPGNFKVSFPDGPISEFTNLQDIFGNQQMNQGAHDTVAYTATGGDYPKGGSLSSVSAPAWPVSVVDSGNNSNQVCAADYCKLAFYDWLRRAPNNLSISSVVNMVTTPFVPDPNSATPGTFTWFCPTMIGGASQTITTLPQGICHIFTFTVNGGMTNIAYTHQNINPEPFSVVSNNQLYVEAVKNNGSNNAGGYFQSHKPNGMSGQGPPTASYNQIQVQNMTISNPHGQPNPTPPTVSDGQIQLQNQYDVFIRDQSRVLSPIGPGTGLGGLHGGEPCDQVPFTASPTRAAASGGDPPIVAIVSDFAENYSSNTYYSGYSTGSGGSSIRPTYQNNGNVAEIRFRRDIQVNGDLGKLLGYQSGYAAEEDHYYPYLP